MYRMLTYNADMTLFDITDFNRLELAETFAEFRKFGQLVLIIDTNTGKCVRYLK